MSEQGEFLYVYIVVKYKTKSFRVLLGLRIIKITLFEPPSHGTHFVSFSEMRDIALSVPEHWIFNSAFPVYFIILRNIRHIFGVHCDHQNEGLKF